ncbi:unnamed protein product [Adineta steineri]|uniref:Uncharacterized protein n=1 Tax=Adineta steineri TaxID=433720 RepID=A0A813MWD6_9BILA|nr:unnamed protein product [Adineta steineri]
MSLQQQIQNESDQFQALFSRLSDTQSSEAALSEARSHLISYQNQARLIQEKIDTFTAAADKEHKRLVDIQGHGIKHIWYKIRGQLKQRLNEQEKKWLIEFEKCKEEEQRLVAVQEQICSTQNHLHQCEIASEIITKLLANGIDCTWNDNNEFNIKNSHAICFNGQSIEGIKPIQTMLMVKTSYDAQIKVNCNCRPWLLTRAACVGSQRYGGTWTGDNRCSWHTLKYNIPMGLNLSLSGFPLIGHDIGGFAGEKPSLELFVRWIQNGIFHPRFCVHSWRPNQDENIDDNNENALWMYEDALPLIHDALRFRKRLQTYLYSLSHEANITGHPLIRPTVYHFQSDIKCRNQSFEFLLGPWLLVASVYEENASTRTLYLPSGTKWYNFWTDEIYDGGQMVTVTATLDIFPLFVREGALLPFHMDEHLEIRVYPFEENGTSEFNIYDDDGETIDCYNELEGKFDLQTIRLTCNKKQIHIETFIIEGKDNKFTWRFPTNEKRVYQINEG